MEIGNIIPHIEALIFASDKPLTSMEITELINNAFGFMEEKLTLEQIQTSIDGIIEKYGSEFYPFEVRESGGGWQFLTKKDFHKTVAQLNGEKFLKRLSSAALETLSIIAYKQPITKGEIESIRGVSSDYSIQKLLEKELINITGRNEDMPGKPLVYATSKTFMDYFGINSAADLPKLKEVFAETLIEPTIINHTPGELIPEEAQPASGDEAVAIGETSSAGESVTGDKSPADHTVAGQPEADDSTLLIVSEDGELVEHEDAGSEELADEEAEQLETDQEEETELPGTNDEAAEDEPSEHEEAADQTEEEQTDEEHPGDETDHDDNDEAAGEHHSGDHEHESGNDKPKHDHPGDGTDHDEPENHPEK